jgi:hypothetical protein
MSIERREIDFRYNQKITKRVDQGTEEDAWWENRMNEAITCQHVAQVPKC